METFSPFGINNFTIPDNIPAEYFFVSGRHSSFPHGLYLLSGPPV